MEIIGPDLIITPEEETKCRYNRKFAEEMVRLKWKLLSESDYPGFIHDTGAATCGFCIMFIYNNCLSCPIADYTRVLECKNTPFEAFYTANKYEDPIERKKQAKLILDLIEKALAV
ncbi:MAG: hypothetical protein WBP54_04315 [Pelodictyon phaeoclathratiforme]